MKTNLPIFKIRCSAINRIMAGEIGLTATQEEKLSDLLSRQNGTHPKGLKLTEKMEVELAELQYKKLNPELPEGAKTYCKEWVGYMIDGRRKEVKSKYIDKGNIVEEDSFTIMSVQLGLGMVYKNEERRSNAFLEGECDVASKGVIYDNKASWEYGNFPMWETENQNKGYEQQLQGYMELWDVDKAVLCYTLVDCPESLVANEIRPWLSDDEKQRIVNELVYTREYFEALKSKFFPNAKPLNFIEIPEKRRVKTFSFERDREFIKKVEERVKLCRKYIQTLIS